MEGYARDTVHIAPQARVPAGRVRLVRLDGRVIPLPERFVQAFRPTFYRDGRPLDLDDITVGFVG